jgi:hypothetical protein
MSFNGNKHYSPRGEQFVLVTEFGRQVIAEIGERFVLRQHLFLPFLDVNLECFFRV